MMKGMPCSGRGGVWAVVLAAGMSRRMQSGTKGISLKQLLPLPPDGQPMVGSVVDTAASCPDLRGIIVVVPDGDEGRAIQSAVGKGFGNAPVVGVENPAFREGQSTSLRVGVRALQSQRADAGLFLLADQPELTAEAIGLVIDQYEVTKASIVQASYLDGPGHPVLFDASLFEELFKVEGDEGGRRVIQDHRDNRVFAKVDMNVPDDVDTPEAYAALCQRLRGARQPQGGPHDSI